MSKLEQLYHLYEDKPDLSTEEACSLLSFEDKHCIYEYRKRLKGRGLIDFNEDGSVVVLKPYKEPPVVSVSDKGGIYREMVSLYMDDFREQTTFADRLLVGREIRLLLDKM